MLSYGPVDLDSTRLPNPDKNLIRGHYELKCQCEWISRPNRKDRILYSLVERLLFNPNIAARITAGNEQYVL